MRIGHCETVQGGAQTPLVRFATGFVGQHIVQPAVQRLVMLTCLLWIVSGFSHLQTLS